MKWKKYLTEKKIVTVQDFEDPKDPNVKYQAQKFGVKIKLLDDEGMVRVTGKEENVKKFMRKMGFHSILIGKKWIDL